MFSLDNEVAFIKWHVFTQSCDWAYYQAWWWHLIPLALCVPISQWYVCWGVYWMLCWNSHCRLDCRAASWAEPIPPYKSVTICYNKWSFILWHQCHWCCAQREGGVLLRTLSTGVAEETSGAQVLAGSELFNVSKADIWWGKLPDWAAHPGKKKK